MTGDERRQRVREYVRDRLRREIDGKPRGYQSKVAKRVGVTTAHMSNLVSANPTRQAGESVCRKAAEYWGISYAELEELACGPSEPPAALATVHAFEPNLDTVRKMLREELAAAIAAALDERFGRKP